MSIYEESAHHVECKQCKMHDVFREWDEEDIEDGEPVVFHYTCRSCRHDWWEDA